MRTIRSHAGQNGSDESPVRLNGIGVRAIRPHVGRVFRAYRTKPCEAGDWIDKISRAWACGPANALALARLLHQARQSMKHGQWSHIWRSPRLPFSKRKAEMLVTVGEVLGGITAKNSAVFAYCLEYPLLYHPAWRDIDQADDCRIQDSSSPVAARGAGIGRRTRPGRVSKRRTPPTLKRRLDRFSNFVLAHSANWPPAECQLVRAELERPGCCPAEGKIIL